MGMNLKLKPNNVTLVHTLLSIIQSKICNDYKLPHVSSIHAGFLYDERKTEVELEIKEMYCA